MLSKLAVVRASNGSSFSNFKPFQPNNYTGPHITEHQTQLFLALPALAAVTGYDNYELDLGLVRHEFISRLWSK